MVLHDPPGGNSYASFENIVITAKVVSDSTHISGYGSSAKELRAGVDVETDAFIGSFGVEACNASVQHFKSTKLITSLF